MPQRVVQIVDDDGTVIEEVSRETIVPEEVNERITETRAARALDTLEAAAANATGTQRVLLAAVAALIRRELHYHDRPAPDPDG